MSEDENQAAAPVVDAPATASPLTAARIAAGLTLADVGRQLKLSAWQVEALETGDYARLPGPVFVRGFIRNYARLLKLDPAQFLPAAPAPAETVAPPAVNVGHSANIPFPGQNSFNWKPYAVVGALVVAGLIGYEIYGDDIANPDVVVRPVQLPEPTVAVETKSAEVAPAVVTPPTPAPTMTTTTTAITLPAQTPAKVAVPVVPVVPVTVPPKSEMAPPSKPAIEPPAVVKPLVEQRPAQASRIEVVATPVQTVKPTVEARPAPAESAAGERVVRMVFSRESWVEVRDRQGRTIFSQLNPAGSAQSISGQPPLRLIVGNATGVRMLYNDRPVDLAPHTQVDVARLTLE